MSQASWYRLMLRPLPLTYLAFFSFLFSFSSSFSFAGFGELPAQTFLQPLQMLSYSN